MAKSTDLAPNAFVALLHRGGAAARVNLAVGHDDAIDAHEKHAGQELLSILRQATRPPFLHACALGFRWKVRTENRAVLLDQPIARRLRIDFVAPERFDGGG